MGTPLNYCILPNGRNNKVYSKDGRNNANGAYCDFGKVIGK